MDPITGIGLAASVIQLVTFSISAAQTCKEFYEKGALDDHSQVDYVATHLGSLAVSIQQSLQKPSSRSQSLSQEEKQLVDLSQKCQSCSQKLQHELRKLRGSPTSIVLAASKAARALWKKNSIEKIQRELESYRLTLETSLLSRLSRRFDAQALKSDERFASLDKSLQYIIECLANSETTLATISVQEAEQTRQYIATQVGRLESLHVDNRRFEEVTRSLFYPEIFSRQEQVEHVFDGIESSYDWIFDKPRTREMDASNHSPHTSAPLWDDFARWLSSGHGIYWVNGKAGSGKSTLMNHICSHKRRLELLQEWSPHRQLLTPSFFFWNSGSRQQKTVDGLLRSLIYQILTKCRQLIACFKDTPIHAWTESRLRNFLCDLLRQTQIDVAICMFIDGLDEFDGDYDRVIEMITNLSDQRHVKICVSSRPLLAFKRAFRGKPCLRLQDLTFNTIREYTEKRLSHLVQQQVYPNGKTQQRAKELLRMVVERADGVFLWAVIAIREVREGLQGMVDLDELAQAIYVLPPELEDLFTLVLKRIKLAFRRDAAKFLQIVLSEDERLGFDLCRLHFISSQQELRDAPFVYEDIAMSELTEACRTLETRLLSHTAGLLELTPRVECAQTYCKRKDWDPISFTRVDFIHQTVRDFLVDNNEAKSFLSDYGLSEAQLHTCVARGTLAHLGQHSQGDAVIHEDWPHPMLHPFQNVLVDVSWAERLSGSAQSRFMQSLDYASLVRGYTVTKNPKLCDWTHEAYWKNGAGTLVDIVGMAAAVGMTIYVCEQLGLSVSSAGYSPSLPDLDKYSTSRARPRCLSWVRADESTDITPRADTLFCPPVNRQALSKCLRWEEDTHANSCPDNQTENISLVESYILCCCDIGGPLRGLDLVRMLLNAGANPMVRVRPMDWKSPHCIGADGARSFWESWLLDLYNMRHIYMDANGKSGGLLLGQGPSYRHLALSDVFDVTKALLANGADINAHINRQTEYSKYYQDFLKRPGLADHIKPLMSGSAMFLLEECFNKEPEFQRFAVAIRPLVKTPTRKLWGISDAVERDYRSGVEAILPSADESKLWPLIEKWEDTGHEKDRVALVTALEQIWEVLRPNLERMPDRTRDSDEESDEESEEELEEETMV